MANAPGIGTHIFPPRGPHDPNRKAVDAVYGPDAPIIEGLPIEVGSGALPTEQQLCHYVVRVWRSEGETAARALINKLMASRDVNQDRFRAELVARGLVRPISAAAQRSFNELQPSGSPN